MICEEDFPGSPGLLEHRIVFIKLAVASENEDKDKKQSPGDGDIDDPCAKMTDSDSKFVGRMKQKRRQQGDEKRNRPYDKKGSG